MTRHHPPATRRSLSAARGFTLIELMVALAGGLIFSVAVFALSRDTSRFYQREARVADATLTAIVGFERLQADIARAGFMTTPNSLTDPMLCAPPTVRQSIPVLWDQLSSVAVTANDATTGSDVILESVGRYPDSLLLTGNYTSVEGVPFNGVDFGAGGGGQVFLRTGTGALARLGYDSMTAAARTNLLETLFPAGRALRIVEETGREHYAPIISINNGNVASVTVGASPLLVPRGTVCGLGARTNGTVNTVNFVQYSIRSLSADPNFAPLFGASVALANIPGEAARTELVREELNPATGAVIPGTTELVAEFAVDLQFGYTGGRGAPGSPVTQLETILPGDGVPANPQRVRAIRARLSVRSREADRSSNATAAERAALGLSATGLYRFDVEGDQGKHFARVRTLQADISLPNQNGVDW